MRAPIKPVNAPMKASIAQSISTARVARSFGVTWNTSTPATKVGSENPTMALISPTRIQPTRCASGTGSVENSCELSLIVYSGG